MKNLRNVSQEYDTIGQIKDHVQKHYVLRYNAVNNKLEYRTINSQQEGEFVEGIYQQLGDEKFNSLILELQKNLQIKVTKEQLRIILNSDFVPTYNPFYEYFSSLPEWDRSTDYIQELGRRIDAVNQEFFQKFFRKWLIAVVACALDPRIENQTVLLLKGGQGIGKTRFLRHLVPDALMEYLYEGNIVPGSKEHERHLAEKFLIIMDEFDTKSERQADALKSLITRQVITARRPYAINPQNMPRVASFCGTTNRDQFLKDPTGNRRFITVAVNSINHEPFHQVDMVWSQAFFLYISQERYYLDQQDIAELNDSNRDYMQIDAIEEYLLQCFRPTEQGEERDAYPTATEIAEELSQKTKLCFSPRLAQRVGMLLTKNRFKKGKSNGSFRYEVKRVSK